MSINNREHQRRNFAPWTWVKVLREGVRREDFKMYKLLDVSEGGISFVTSQAEEFRRGDRFEIIEIEGRNMPAHLIAIVRYVKALDEFGIDYKIGCEFIAKTLKNER